jgi:hypothetical protein
LYNRQERNSRCVENHKNISFVEKKPEEKIYLIDIRDRLIS